MLKSSVISFNKFCLILALVCISGFSILSGVPDKAQAATNTFLPCSSNYPCMHLNWTTSTPSRGCTVYIAAQITMNGQELSHQTLTLSWIDVSGQSHLFTSQPTDTMGVTFLQFVVDASAPYGQGIPVAVTEAYNGTSYTSHLAFAAQNFGSCPPEASLQIASQQVSSVPYNTQIASNPDIVPVQHLSAESAPYVSTTQGASSQNSAIKGSYAGTLAGISLILISLILAGCRKFFVK